MTNWKYTKGSEKDFDGAPDWVNYRVEGTLGFEYYTGEMVEGGYFVPCSSPLQEPSKMTGLFKKCSITAQREPVTAWGGEGIPPVGVECEYTLNGMVWRPCRIEMLVGSQGVVMSCDVPEWIQYVHNNNYPKLKFRPIKSEAELKRDSTMKAIANIRDFDDYKIAACMVEPIYNAIAAGNIPHVKLDD